VACIVSKESRRLLLSRISEFFQNKKIKMGRTCTTFWMEPYGKGTVWESRNRTWKTVSTQVFVKGVVISTGFKILIYFNKASSPASDIQKRIGK
jgi:hypothetical protein